MLWGDQASLDRFEALLSQPDLLVGELGASVVELATQLRACNGLRTPDALQVACCLIARSDSSKPRCWWRPRLGVAARRVRWISHVAVSVESPETTANRHVQDHAQPGAVEAGFDDWGYARDMSSASRSSKLHRVPGASHVRRSGVHMIQSSR